MKRFFSKRNKVSVALQQYINRLVVTFSQPAGLHAMPPSPMVSSGNTQSKVHYVGRLDISFLSN